MLCSRTIDDRYRRWYRRRRQCRRLLAVRTFNRLSGKLRWIFDVAFTCWHPVLRCVVSSMGGWPFNHTAPSAVKRAGLRMRAANVRPMAAVHRRDVRDFSAWAKSSLGLSPERLRACSPNRHEAKSIRRAMAFVGEDGVAWVMRTHGSALNGMAMWLTMLVPVLAWVTALVGSWFLN